VSARRGHRPLFLLFSDALDAVRWVQSRRAEFTAMDLRSLWPDVSPSVLWRRAAALEAAGVSEFTARRGRFNFYRAAG
jgi:hypothetical protein